MVLAKLMTDMITPTGPAAGLAGSCDILAKRVIAMHCEVDPLFAVLKLGLGGGEGGHIGLRNISKALSTMDTH